MRTDIDRKGTADPLHVQFVRAKQEEHVERAHHASNILAALPRHEAEIETADARSCRVQNGEAVPLFRDCANRGGKLAHMAKHRPAVRTGKRALADNDHW